MHRITRYFDQPVELSIVHRGYDKNGNRTGNQTHLGATNSSTVTANNQISTDGVYNYTWYDEGNMTSRTLISTSVKEEFVYDHRNRLQRVRFKDSGGTILSTTDFRYDERNRMVRRVEDPDGPGVLGNNFELFIHDGNQIVLQFQKIQLGAPTLTNRYLWGPEVDQLLADEQVTSLASAGTVYWVLADQINNVRDLATYNSGTDTTTIAKHRTFDSFGNITSDSAPGIKEWFAFQGKWFEISFSATWHIHRWFNTVLGKWQGQDPIGFNAGDANLTRMVENHPTYSTDPTGLSPAILVPLVVPAAEALAIDIAFNILILCGAKKLADHIHPKPTPPTVIVKSYWEDGSPKEVVINGCHSVRMSKTRIEWMMNQDSPEEETDRIVDDLLKGSTPGKKAQPSNIRSQAVRSKPIMTLIRLQQELMYRIKVRESGQQRFVTSPQSQSVATVLRAIRRYK